MTTRRSGRRGRGVVAATVLGLLLTATTQPTARAAAALPGWSCGFSVMPPVINAVDDLRSGRARIYYQSYDVSGDITWMQNEAIGARLHVQSLKWVEPLIETGKPDDLEQARTIVLRWAGDHIPGPTAAGDPVMSWYDHAVAMRATTLACLRLALGGPDDDLDQLLTRHIEWLADPANHNELGNHGLAADVGLIAAACVLGDPVGVEVGRARAEQAAVTVVDEQGATNEQAPLYAEYVHDILVTLRRQLSDCSSGTTPDFSRVPLLRRFMMHATQPDGRVVPLGDSGGRFTGAYPGTRLGYALSLGAEGPAPSRRVAVYDAGYVFARSGWGRDRPFQEEDFWSLRFGPGTILHGHADRMSVTLHARGRPMVIDTGVGNYVWDDFRAFVKSPQAHNLTVVPGARYRSRKPTRLLRSGSTRRDETFTVRDRAFLGVRRTRTVFAAHDRPVMLIVDQAKADQRRTFEQLWHIHPGLVASPVSDGGVRFRAESDNDALLVQSVAMPGRSPSEVSVVSGQTDPYQGWLASPRQPVPAVTFRSEGISQNQVTLLVHSGKRAGIRWTVVPKWGFDRLRIRVGARRLVLDIDRRSGWVTRRR